MVGRDGDSHTGDNARVQVIAGRDGRPAFAILPIEVFLVLLANARRSGAIGAGESAERGTSESRLLDRLLERGVLGSTRPALSADELHELLRAHLPEEMSNEGIEEVLRWLSEDFISSGTSITRALDANDEDALDVAAYDAAKRSGEERFPLEVADRLIAGEAPIKVFREYRHLTQKELAKEAKTTAPYLSQIETGRRRGSIELLRRLADALAVDLDDLV